MRKQLPVNIKKTKKNPSDSKQHPFQVHGMDQGITKTDTYIQANLKFQIYLKSTIEVHT